MVLELLQHCWCWLTCMFSLSLCCRSRFCPQKTDQSPTGHLGTSYQSPSEILEYPIKNISKHPNKNCCCNHGNTKHWERPWNLAGWGNPPKFPANICQTIKACPLLGFPTDKKKGCQGGEEPAWYSQTRTLSEVEPFTVQVMETSPREQLTVAVLERWNTPFRSDVAFVGVWSNISDKLHSSLDRG